MQTITLSMKQEPTVKHQAQALQACKRTRTHEHLSTSMGKTATSMLFVSSISNVHQFHHCKYILDI